MQLPFPKNYVDGEGEEEPDEEQIHHFGDVESNIYLTKIEHNLYAQEEDLKGFEEESE